MNRLPEDNDIKVILGLQGLVVQRVQAQGDEGWVVEADLPAKAGCPRCGEESNAVHDRRAKASRLEWVFQGRGGFGCL